MATKKHKGQPFTKSRVVANCKILSVIPADGLKEYKYEVQYKCCGRTYTLTHKRMTARLRIHSTLCEICARERQAEAMRKTPDFDVGETVSGAEILEITSASSKRKQKYLVKHGCCGAEQVYSWSGLKKKRSLNRRLCTLCATRNQKKNKAKVANDAKEKARIRNMIDAKARVKARAGFMPRVNVKPKVEDWGVTSWGPFLGKMGFRGGG